MASETNAGRWTVIVAGLLGGFFLVQRLIADDSLYTSFIKGMGAVVAVMVVVGAARRFWRGDKMSGAQGAGFGLNFVARAALRPLRTLEERVNQQMNAMSRRVDVLEREVGLKESSPRPEKRD